MASVLLPSLALASAPRVVPSPSASVLLRRRVFRPSCVGSVPVPWSGRCGSCVVHTVFWRNVSSCHGRHAHDAAQYYVVCHSPREHVQLPKLESDDKISAPSFLYIPFWTGCFPMMLPAKLWLLLAPFFATRHLYNAKLFESYQSTSSSTACYLSGRPGVAEAPLLNASL